VRAGAVGWCGGWGRVVQKGMWARAGHACGEEAAERWQCERLGMWRQCVAVHAQRIK